MRKLLILAALLLAVTSLFAKTTTIYHTSDTHGFFYPKKGQGGFAALAAVLKKGAQPYLLLDSGDFSNGTAETKNSKGLKAVELMNALGYQATTIGNHEFDFKDAGVAPILKHIRFSVLAANFVNKDTGLRPEGVKAYQIFDVDGVKVAVIGLANRTPTNESKIYTFTKPLVALENALNRPDVKQADVVVVIVHDSLQDDKHGTQSYVSEIATKFGGRVHIVMGGHAHKIFQNEYINGVLFVESGSYVQNVSRIEVETDDKTGRFVSAKSELIPLVVEKTGLDEKVAALAERLKEPGVDEVFGTAAETIHRGPVAEGHKDGPLNDWIADLGRAYAGTEIFVHNNGGTRVDMEEGVVTKRDTLDIHPFENTVVKMTVDGRFIKFLVKNSLLPKSLFSYSGLTITYCNKKGKVKDIKILVNGKPLRNRQKYTLATNEYIAYGGSEGWPFKRIADETKEPVGTANMRLLLEEGIKASSPVKEIPTGRIVELP